MTPKQFKAFRRKLEDATLWAINNGHRLAVSTDSDSFSVCPLGALNVLNMRDGELTRKLFHCGVRYPCISEHLSPHEATRFIRAFDHGEGDKRKPLERLAIAYRQRAIRRSAPR